MSPGGRAYKLQDFLDACGDPNKIFVHRGAMQTADSDFGLKTMGAIAQFISNGGLESAKHANTDDWENNPEPKENPIKVDSYDFFSGPEFGYIAFFYNPKTSLWNIKSFKKNEKQDPRSMAEIARRAKEKLK